MSELLTLVRGDDSNFLNEVFLNIDFSNEVGEHIDINEFKVILTIENSHKYTKTYKIEENSVEIVLNKFVSSSLDIGEHRCSLKLVDPLGRVKTIKNFTLNILDEFDSDNSSVNSELSVKLTSSDYRDLINKPTINNVVIEDNVTFEDLGIKEFISEYIPCTVEEYNQLLDKVNKLEEFMDKFKDVVLIDIGEELWRN